MFSDIYVNDILRDTDVMIKKQRNHCYIYEVLHAGSVYVVVGLYGRETQTTDQTLVTSEAGVAFNLAKCLSDLALPMYGRLRGREPLQIHHFLKTYVFINCQGVK